MVTNYIQFKNLSKYPLISVIAADGKQFIQGEMRPAILIHVDPKYYDSIASDLNIVGNTESLILSTDVTTDEVVAAPTEEDPTATKIQTTTKHTEKVYSNYSIVQSLGLEQVMIAPATDTTPVVTEMQVIIMLGQLTYNQVIQQTQQKQIDALMALTI